jgi:subtilisin family serine protease
MQVLRVIPRKSRLFFLLLASTILSQPLLTACGGGGGGGGGSLPPPSITSPQGDAGFYPDSSFAPFSSSSNEYGRSPNLNAMGLNPYYDIGLSGSGVSVGVLDSGVDSEHEELIGRVDGGGDWQGATRGLQDQFGHGTHVASILAAARNERGIHGVAPGAGVVSYRILDAFGKFGSQSGNIMLPAILGDAASRQLPVLNNSWASIYEINDIGKSTLDIILEQELRSYHEIARPDGPVMVWAAGNGSAEEVSIRSGLPYFYPDLRPNWLAVVGVDADLHEPRYTNRCGVAQAWCITAPGGGDDQFSDGVFAALPGDSYGRKSGTSMAAPFVSGSLALLLERFPSMTPRQAAARLLVTADYRGLVTADGCTIERCTEADMAAVFGQGLINIPDALQPIGATSVEISSNFRLPLRQSLLVTPAVLGGSVQSALDGRAMLVRDSFDNAPFMVSLTSMLPISDYRYAAVPAILWDPSGDHALTGFRLAATGMAPVSSRLSARLTDISADTDADWVGYETRFGDHNAQVVISPGVRRQVAHGMIWRETNNSQGWIGAGVDHLADVPDGYAKGAFNSAASSHWVFAGNQYNFQRFSVTAEMLFGATRLSPDHPEQSLLTEIDYRFDAARLGFEAPLGATSQLGVDLTLPPALRDGRITLRLPIGIDVQHGQTRFQDYSESLSIHDREKRLGVSFTHQSTHSLNLYAAVGISLNDGHQKGKSRQSAAFGLRKRF